MNEWADKIGRMASFDLETYIIEAGRLAPRIVCGSTATPEDAGRLLDRDAAIAHAEALLRGDGIIVGANLAFDLACIAVARPDLLEPIFALYEAGRAYDVQVAMALDAISYGLLFTDPRTMAPLRDPETNKQARYSLAVCVDLALGRADAKKNDFWRKRYALLEKVPIADWPPEARQYPVDDAVNTLEVAVAQVVGGGAGCVPGPLRNLDELSHQTESAFDLHLGALRGVRTYAPALDALRAKVEPAHRAYVERFAKLGFFHKHPKTGALVLDPKTGEPKEDTAAVKRAVVLAYGGSGKCPDGCLGGKVISPTSGNPINCKTCSGTGLDITYAPKTDTGGVSCNRDALMESGDADLVAYGENEPEKIRSTYIPFLEQGLDRPLVLRPNVLVSSMRTSYDGVIQQFPREGGVRECVRARGAWCGDPVEYVFCSVDYAAIELCTLAQIIYWLFDKSTMMDTINATGDPGMLHTAFAAQLAGITTEEMVARVKGLRGPELKKWAKDMRTAAKAGNFGFPGGMGAAKFVLSKRKKNEGTTTAPDGLKYPGIRFCLLLPGPSGSVEERCGVEKVTEWNGHPCPPICKACVTLVAEVLRPAWFKAWPEIGPAGKPGTYFHWVDGKVKEGGEFPCWGTDCVRGGLDFTNGANHGFQNLAAIGGKNGLRMLTRECYLGRKQDGSPSPLAGTRPIFWTHDESTSEMPRATAHLAALRKAEVLVEGMRAYVHDVHVVAEPALSEFWTKAAEPVWDDDGVLQVWQPKAAA